MLVGAKGRLMKTLVASSETVFSFSYTHTVVMATVNSVAGGMLMRLNELTGLSGLCLTASSRRDFPS